MSTGPMSRAWMERAERVLPGGVSSPVRAFRSVGGTPFVVRRGSGAMLEDVDGRHYVDFICSWGPLILGHAHPAVVGALADAASRGTTYGAPAEREVELAEWLVAAYQGLEQVRFVSSGTEATMSAIRVARGATGRDRIVKFAGCYHGHADALLVAAGSGLATFGVPSSAGVPEAYVAHTHVLPLDDVEAFQAYMQREGDRVAAVIVEPIPANHGLLLQRREFLDALRTETARVGAVLIFDEVISGFRVARGGAAALYGIVPDLATFGKIIGGGLPVGAFGGRRDLMRHLAPEGPVYQAGTLSGNALAMAAGLATLRHLDAVDGWGILERLGQELDTLLTPVIAEAPFPVQLVRQGSLFWLALQGGDPPRTPAGIDAASAPRYATMFHALLARGIAMAPSAFEVGFLSIVHSRGHLEQLRDALRDAWTHAGGRRLS